MSLHDDLLKMTELVRGDGFWKNSDEDDTTSGDYIKAARSLGIALNFLAQTHNWM